MNNSSETGTQFCPNCGQAVTVGTQFCPKCGTRLPQSQPQKTISPQPVQVSHSTQSTVAHPTNVSNVGMDRFALIGLILGLTSWGISLWGLVGIGAVVFSSLALNRHVSGSDKIMAIIGLASGILTILYAISQF
ncbi:zinc-ribbon domain-containing protein [Levilactobacillus humaensis]|uniref:zinc-ribbon domain-containing protein n=1 Tax=Levilactobacillus humaensis TaxID=2950375 RepID=UPI0021C44684|nr:zinc-ribbon domain-containing protein [Levilactobacillus humaensis]